ncbi:MAG: HNH endonuclease signature motif containing protein [Chitinophagaceae bacterium]
MLWFPFRNFWRKKGIPPRQIKSRIGRDGYYSVRLTREGKTSTKLVHRILAEAFVKNSLNRPFVNHIDGNKLNNDIGNLEWVTHAENMNNCMNF